MVRKGRGDAMAKVTFLSFYVEYSVGIYVLSSILEEAGHDVSVVLFKLPMARPIDWFKEKPRNMEWVNQYGDIIGSDIEVNPWTETEVELLIDKINTLSPDVLCISARSTHRDLVIDLLPKIRTRCRIPTIAGGYGPTFEPELYVDLVDYVFIGEAENAIAELVDHLSQGNSIAHLDNIAFKRNGTMIVNPLRVPEVKTIRQVVPDKFFYIENDCTFGYADRGKVIKTHTYSTFFGRGCISSCSYCSAGHWRDIYKKQGINIKKRRNRDIEDVIEELKCAKDQNYTFILLRDEFLCAEVKEMKQFFRLYEREIHLPFWAYLVPEQILSNPELLTMAVDAGFVDTEVGFQSGSDAINRDIFTRNISNSRTLAYTKLLAAYDINIRYDFIIFNPAETEADILATYGLIQALPKKRGYLALNRLFFFPVSPIARIIRDYPSVNGGVEHYYCQALLYLLCFVMPPDEFGNHPEKPDADIIVETIEGDLR